MAKVTTLKQEGKLSHLIKVVTDKRTFTIPVIDVRDGEGERELAKNIIKSANRSRFMQPTFGAGGGSYQSSPKSK